MPRAKLPRRFFSSAIAADDRRIGGPARTETNGGQPGAHAAPSTAREEAPRMPRDHQLFVGRDYPRGGAACGGADARAVPVVRVLVQLDAQPGGVPADARAHDRIALADTRREHD